MEALHMGIFDRFKRVVKSNINQMISKAEDPEKMLNQLIVDMNEQLVESKKSVASAIADEKRLERQANEHRRKAEEWEKRAVLALRASEKEPERRTHYEDLAKKALSQKKECDVTAGKYQEQYAAQHDSVEKLKTALSGLQQRIEEAQRKKNLLIARARRAEAQKKIQDQISGLADTSAFDAFEKMASRVEQIEAEADAIGEIAGPANTLENEFAQLESGGSDDAMLEDLRKKMALEDKTGSSGSASSSSSGAAPSADPEVDSMMEELKKKLNE
jgi:phage shock protein A